MKELPSIEAKGKKIKVLKCGVLVIGSGAAALATAERLSALSATKTGDGNAPINEARVLIATERLLASTSYLSGSDKQTYYRLSLSGEMGDSAYSMADSLWSGGSIHGDIALAEAVGSMEAFYSLVSIGVPFPQDPVGGFVGYKTDHDPQQRGTSLGPYTSRVMVERLVGEVRRRNDIAVREDLQAVSLIVTKERKACGAIFLDLTKTGSDEAYGLVAIIAEHTVFGTGGPAGLYESTVYPTGQYGSIGLAIEREAFCCNLTESQFGIASVQVRWNLSGTYQQAIPRYYSVGNDGVEHDFLSPVFGDPGKRDSAVFLKGYQWPFDPRKVKNLGSSLIDLLVHRERQLYSRKVFIDFRRNPESWNPNIISKEAKEYLINSGALQESNTRLNSPLERLIAMNPPAFKHYLENGIDLSRVPLEITVAAQHNNGGLEGDLWWESSNIRNLFPVGEVNGSHGVYRPGGSALNAGQVGAIRAARKINSARADELLPSEWRPVAEQAVTELLDIIESALRAGFAGFSARDYAEQFRKRMDAAGGILRDNSKAARYASDALAQFHEISKVGIIDRSGIPELLRIRHLALAHAAYLDAISAYIAEGGGSRGSYLIANQEGEALNTEFNDSWRAMPEDATFRDVIQHTQFHDGLFSTEWIPRRLVPRNLDSWFENVWREWREGKVYDIRSIPSQEGK